MIIEVNLIQSENAEFSIEVTELGMVIERYELQPENASSPIEVMLFPKVIILIWE